MKTKSFSVRQLIVFLVAFCPITKLFLFPSSLSFESGRDGYITVALFCLMDFITLLAILLVYKKHPDRSFSDILEDFGGKIFAKIVMILYALYFIIRIFPISFESKIQTAHTVYESNPSFITFIPTFIIITYIAIKGFNPIARTGELLFPITLASLLGIYFLSINSIDIQNFKPILEFGALPIVSPIPKFTLWFGDVIVFMFLLKDIKQSTKDTLRIILGMLFSILLIVGFFVIFYGIFGELAIKQDFAISKISKYNIAFSNLGRLDWIFILVVNSGTIINISLMLCCGVKCISYCFPKLKSWHIVIPITVILWIIIYYLKDNYSLIYWVFSSFLSPPALVFQYVIPILLPLMAMKKKKRSLSYEE